MDGTVASEAVEQAPMVEVHNAWTIYGTDEDGSESDDKMACFERPQNWGDPCWHYEKVTLDWTAGGTRYINHAHLWTDVQRETPMEYLKLFAGLIVMINIPGGPAHVCGREYLAEDDFWAEEWGPLPDFYNGESDDDEFERD